MSSKVAEEIVTAASTSSAGDQNQKEAAAESVGSTGKGDKFGGDPGAEGWTKKKSTKKKSSVSKKEKEKGGPGSNGVEVEVVVHNEKVDMVEVKEAVKRDAESAAEDSESKPKDVQGQGGGESDGSALGKLAAVVKTGVKIKDKIAGEIEELAETVTETVTDFLDPESEDETGKGDESKPEKEENKTEIKTEDKIEESANPAESTGKIEITLNGEEIPIDDVADDDDDDDVVTTRSRDRTPKKNLKLSPRKDDPEVEEVIELDRIEDEDDEDVVIIPEYKDPTKTILKNLELIEGLEIADETAEALKKTPKRQVISLPSMCNKYVAETDTYEPFSNFFAGFEGTYVTRTSGPGVLVLNFES